MRQSLGVRRWLTAGAVLAALGGSPPEASADAAAAAPTGPSAELAEGARLGDAAFVRTGDPDLVLALARSAGPRLGYTARLRLADDLAGRFAGDEAALAKLPPARFAALYAAVRELGALGQARRGWLTAYVRPGGAWEGATPAELTGLLADTPLVTASAGPAHEARAGLVAHALAKHLSSDGLAAARDKAPLFRLAAAAGPRAGKEQREALLEALGEAIVARDAALGSLGVRELAELRPALVALRAPRAAWPEALARWTGANPAWKSGPPADLALLLQISADAAGEPAGKQVAEAAAAAAADAGRWEPGGSPAAARADLLGLIEALAGRLSPGRRQALLGRVAGALGEKSVVATIAPEELVPLRSALLKLDPSGGTGAGAGKPSALGAVVEVWLAAADWKRLPPERMARVVAATDAHHHPALKTAQAQVLGCVGGDAYLRGLTAGGLAKLAPALARLGAGIDTDTLVAVVGGGGPLVPVAERWMKVNPKWQEGSLEDLAALARTLDASVYPALEPLQTRVLAPARRRLGDAYAKAGEADPWFAALEALTPALSAEGKEHLLGDLAAWAAKDPAKLQARSPEQVLRLLTKLQSGRPAPATTAVLTAWSAAEWGLVDPPDGAYGALWTLAQAADPKAEATIESRLTGQGGEPRLRAAMLLNWARVSPAKSQPWQAQLERRAAASGGDGQAAWFTALAHLEETRPLAEGESLDPMRGRPWLTKAFSRGQAEPLRLLALRWLVARHLDIQEFDRAGSLLASVSGQFQDAASRRRIDGLKSGVARAADAERFRQALLERRSDADHLRGQVRYFQDQAQEAKRRGLPADEASATRTADVLRAKLLEAER